MTKTLPTTEQRLTELAHELPTPFHLYDERGIRENARAFREAFAWAPGFRNYYAVKAAPTPALLKILAEEGCGADCSSLAELELSERVGITGESIMFTSNDTPPEEFRRAYELGAVINLDDITHIAALEEALGGTLPELLSFRYNPGPERTGNAIIGNPVEAKYGVTSGQLLDAYRAAQAGGVRRFALHTMVASNELDPAFIIETARMLFTLAVRLKDELGIELEFVNLGGGIGIPYRPEQQAMSYQEVSDGIRALYDSIIRPAGLDGLRLSFECGRVMTGPYGYLVSQVRHVTHKYKDYVGLDACMANLMRPAMYGSYHHITVLNKGEGTPTQLVDVTGSLCENNDKFAIDRDLPVMERGDVVVIHDAGAHGHSMG
ncbi:MAG: diaminopimelate decarboxylase, partial [Deinococcus sp.]|nr:diaminopimelate decarboxylase [Deinococcus sp.]